MAKSIQLHRGTAFWVVRFYTLNAVAVAVCLICFMVMFGILTASLRNGLTFPLAVFSMAAEGSLWGVWMLPPFYLLPIAILAWYLRRQDDGSPRST
ncbi:MULTISPECIES: hypothetical protein [unclassified Sphingomonas]|uniref:hypothetical protein n=1 Tax=unclassified Sphingomonas TaxID=196159 RepID=UPI00226ADE2A|nr:MULTISPECIES: hypothetical protein [unclassified Sphingomonas]